MVDARITIRDDVVELRALELPCLDGMLGGLWQEARRGNLGADRLSVTVHLSPFLCSSPSLGSTENSGCRIGP